jgi:AcrR family transcriptional regulator
MARNETVDWAGLGGTSGSAQSASLRERKKARLRQQLSDTATQMFLARGFDAVRVSDIAAACEVSEKTVYNYFPTKESLVLDRWDSTASALRAGLADASVHPVDAVSRILSGELRALESWLADQQDTQAAIRSVRRFGELIDATPALRSYQNERMNELTQIVTDLLAARAGLAADDPEPQVAAVALIGLWRVHFTALSRHLTDRSTPAATCGAVAAAVAAAAALITAGLGSFSWTA